MAAIESVCIAEGLPHRSILDVLVDLVDKSMVLQDREHGGMRFWLLQTLREFGLERLSEAGELETTRVAHSTYFLSWMERIAPLLLGAEQVEWLVQLDREYENVRVALEWMLDENGMDMGRAEQALRLCIALMGFWEIRGYIAEGLAFMERALALGMNVAPSIRAMALHHAGFLALMQDDSMRAEEFLRESQLLIRESGDKLGMANILRLQGNLAMTKNNYKIARRLLEETLHLYQTLGDIRKTTWTRYTLAQVAISQGNYSKALSLEEENLASHRILGEYYGTSYPLYHKALALFLSKEDPVKARELAEESLTLFRAVGNRRLIGYVLILLGEILLVEREDERAHSMLGEVLVAHGEAKWAVQLWGKAATVRAEIVAPMPPMYRPAYIQAVASARQSLDEEAFQMVWTKGSHTSLEQVLLTP